MVGWDKKVCEAAMFVFIIYYCYCCEMSRRKKRCKRGKKESESQLNGHEAPSDGELIIIAKRRWPER